MNLTIEQLKNFIEKKKNGTINQGEIDLINEYDIFISDIDMIEKLPDKIKKEYEEKVFLIAKFFDFDDDRANRYALLTVHKSLDSFISYV